MHSKKINLVFTQNYTCENTTSHASDTITSSVFISDSARQTHVAVFEINTKNTDLHIFSVAIHGFNMIGA